MKLASMIDLFVGFASKRKKKFHQTTPEEEEEERLFEFLYKVRKDDVTVIPKLFEDNTHPGYLVSNH